MTNFDNSNQYSLLSDSEICVVLGIHLSKYYRIIGNVKSKFKRLKLIGYKEGRPLNKPVIISRYECYITNLLLYRTIVALGLVKFLRCLESWLDIFNLNIWGIYQFYQLCLEVSLFSDFCRFICRKCAYLSEHFKLMFENIEVDGRISFQWFEYYYSFPY